jgi:hypothetical protein
LSAEPTVRSQIASSAFCTEKTVTTRFLWTIHRSTKVPVNAPYDRILHKLHNILAPLTFGRDRRDRTCANLARHVCKKNIDNQILFPKYFFATRHVVHQTRLDTWSSDLRFVFFCQNVSQLIVHVMSENRIFGPNRTENFCEVRTNRRNVRRIARGTFCTTLLVQQRVSSTKNRTNTLTHFHIKSQQPPIQNNNRCTANRLYCTLR